MRTLLSLAILFGLSLSAQTTFAPLGAVWTYTQHYAGGPDSALFTITCVGDTVIEGHTCSVLQHAGGISQCMGFSARVAVSGDSVITWDPIDSTYRTLYIFGLSPGEGWETVVARGHWDLGSWVVVYDTLSFQVTASDTAMIDGNALRRSMVAATWSLDFPHQTVAFSGTVIERLGHSGFMFPWIDGACDFEFNGPLRCYEDPEISWLNPQFEQCDLSTAIAVSQPPSDLTVYPSIQHAGGTFTNSAPARSSLEVLDATGRRVALIGVQGGKAELILDRPGVYLVRSLANRSKPIRIVVE